MFTIIAAALVFPGVICAAAQDAAGRYDAVECKAGDEYYDCEGEYLLLNKDGSGEILFNNAVYPIEWTQDKDTVSFTDEDDITCTGTIKDGTIKAECYDYEYVYTLTEKAEEDAAAAGGDKDAADADDEAAAAADGEDADEAGTDDAEADSDDAESADEAGTDDAEADAAGTDDADADADSGSGSLMDNTAGMSSGSSGGPVVYDIVSRDNVSGASGVTEDGYKLDYIALNDDGTGVFFFNFAAFSIRWTKDGNKFTFTDHLNNEFDGTLEGTTISGDYGKYHYVFEKTDYVLPAYTLSPGQWGKDLDPVTDQADVLTDDVEAELTKRAQKLADEYDVGVYMVLLDKRDDYTWCQDIEMLGEELRAGYAIGVGPTDKKAEHDEHHNEDWKDSILLTVAFDVRKYDICVSGDYGNWAINQYGRESIRDSFVDDFEDDKWKAGVYHYMDKVEDVLQAASKGKPLTFKNDTMGRMIGLVLPLLLALFFGYGIAAAMRASLQNTSKAQTAATYIDSDQGNFTRREDRYIWTSVSRVYSPRKESGSGGGHSSSGSGHTSGSF